MDEEIKKWLDSKEKNYQEGLILLLKYCRNMSMKHFLTRKEYQAKLEYELRKLMNTKIHEKKALPTSLPLKEERTTITKDGKIRFEDLPEALQNYYSKNAEDYKLMRALHEKLKQAKDKQSRATLRKEIIEYDNAITGRWTVIDRYITTGELPEIKPEPEPGKTLTPQTVNALRTTISRNLEALEKNNVPDEKKAGVIEKIRTAATKLIEGGQSLSQEVIDRLKVYNASPMAEEKTPNDPESINEPPEDKTKTPEDA
jgi:hypothetical protein